MDAKNNDLDNNDNTNDDVKEIVREYYGEELTGSGDLKTSACCLPEAMPPHLLRYLSNVHDEVKDKFYGCGSPVPEAVKGKTVLDLGCGTGMDAYMISQMVGPEGMVIGIDMTDQQLAIANKYVSYHMDKFGFDVPNVMFKKGFIEDLRESGIEDESVDVVISNCVINLSADKEKVFEEIFHVLKPGGELLFADIFSHRRIPAELQNDKVLRGECLGGAMYIEDFRRMLARMNCLDYRVVSAVPLGIEDEAIREKVGHIPFTTMTVRTFRCAFEDLCEDYGHTAVYKGTVEGHPEAFTLDDHHVFRTGERLAVCGNTARMLSETRLAAHFEVTGDFSTHYGPFDCAPGGGIKPLQSVGGSGGACC